MSDIAENPSAESSERSSSTPGNAATSEENQLEAVGGHQSRHEKARETVQSKAIETKLELQYPRGARLFFIYFGLLLVVLVAGLDRSIVATAVPKITSEFNSLPDVGWYGSAYLLTACCFQLLFGKLFIEFATKWVFLSALVIFEVGSIICATAASSIVLVIGRAVAGVGCAGLIAGCLIIIAETVPLHKRPKYTGSIGGSIVIAQILAPTLGGVFTDRLTWRWCFWINLPLGGITIIIILFFLPVVPHSGPPKAFSMKTTLARLDILGTAILMPAIVTLLLALQYGGTQYDWKNWRIVLCLVVFSVLTLTWFCYQIHLGEQATVPLRIMRQRSVASGILFTLTGFSNFFIMTYRVPIWFQSVRSCSAQQSGINWLAATVAMSLTTILTGFLTSKIGYYAPQMIASSIIMSIGTGLIYTFNISTSTGYWVGALVLFGIGMGLGSQAPIMAVQTVLAGPDIAIGVAVTVFIQSLASSIFLSVGDNIFQQRLVPNVDPAVVIANGASGLREAMQIRYPKFVGDILAAYDQALRSVFLIGLVFACLSVFGSMSVEWVSVRQHKQNQ